MVFHFFVSAFLGCYSSCKKINKSPAGARFFFFKYFSKLAARALDVLAGVRLDFFHATDFEGSEHSKEKVHEVCILFELTVGDKIKFPLCTDSPPTCERSCQRKSPESRPKVASGFRRTLNIIKKVADLFLSRENNVCARIQFRPKSRACASRTRRSCNFAY